MKILSFTLHKYCYQVKINQWPGMAQLGRKDNLFTVSSFCLRWRVAAYPSDFSFSMKGKHPHHEI